MNSAGRQKVRYLVYKVGDVNSPSPCSTEPSTNLFFLKTDISYSSFATNRFTFLPSNVLYHYSRMPPIVITISYAQALHSKTTSRVEDPGIPQNLHYKPLITQRLDVDDKSHPPLHISQN